MALVREEEAKIKDTTGFLYNNEDQNMKEKEIEAHELATKLKTIRQVQMGKHKLETWYFSPLPAEYQNINCLYICDFCLYFFAEEDELTRHSKRCLRRYPPGD